MKNGQLIRLQINDPAPYDGVNPTSGDALSPKVPRGKVWRVVQGSLQTLMTAAVGTRTLAVFAKDAGGHILAVGGYGTVASESRIGVFMGSIGMNPPPSPSYSSISVQATQGACYIVGGGFLNVSLLGAKAGDQVSTIQVDVFEMDEKDFDVAQAMWGK